MGFIDTPFKKLLVELEAVSEWFDRLGANAKSSRLGAYVSEIRNLVQAQETNQHADLSARDVQLRTALFEAHDLVTLHRTFSATRFDAFVSGRLKRIASGPTRYVEEEGSSANAPRNFAFELLVAGKLLRGGLALSSVNGDAGFE